jgi:hypothetical protein
MNWNVGERVKVSAQYPTQEYIDERATVVKVWPDGLCRIELDREISVKEGKPTKQFNLNGRYLVVSEKKVEPTAQSVPPHAPPEPSPEPESITPAPEPDPELVEQIVAKVQKAIAENDAVAANEIARNTINRDKTRRLQTAVKQALNPEEKEVFRSLANTNRKQSQPQPVEAKSTEPIVLADNSPELESAEALPDVPKANETGTNQPEFKIGDRVMITEHTSPLHNGAKGEISAKKDIGHESIWYQVRLDKASHGQWALTVTIPRKAGGLAYLMKEPKKPCK